MNCFFEQLFVFHIILHGTSCNGARRGSREFPSGRSLACFGRVYGCVPYGTPPFLASLGSLRTRFRFVALLICFFNFCYFYPHSQQQTLYPQQLDITVRCADTTTMCALVSAIRLASAADVDARDQARADKHDQVVVRAMREGDPLPLPTTMQQQPKRAEATDYAPNPLLLTSFIKKFVSLWQTSSLDEAQGVSLLCSLVPELHGCESIVSSLVVCSSSEGGGGDDEVEPLNGALGR